MEIKSYNLNHPREQCELGYEIAGQTEWNGDAIVRIFLTAIKDCRYHEFSRIVEAAWRIQENVRKERRAKDRAEGELLYERNVRGPAMRDAVEEMVKEASE